MEIAARTSATLAAHARNRYFRQSVKEAVLLTDRVIVMSAGSGGIESDIMIELPRSRDIPSAEFNVVPRDVARQLTSHLVPRRALASAEG